MAAHHSQCNNMYCKGCVTAGEDEANRWHRAYEIAHEQAMQNGALANRLREALENLLEVSACQNGCDPSDMTCATVRARAALKQ